MKTPPNRPSYIPLKTWREIYRKAYEAQRRKPIVEAALQEIGMQREAQLRAADELDAQGEHEAAALLR